jgi:hypothetical protein
VSAALLISCSGSGAAGLIPAGNAGPLRGDFEAVARAAETGNGKCAETEAALARTESDFTGLPSSVNAKLRNTLRQGIANLKVRALELCSQPVAQSTTQAPPTTTTKTATTPSTPTTTTTTKTSTTPSTPTHTTTTPGGGTPPEEESKGSEPGGAGGEEAGKGAGVEQEATK